MYVLVRNFVLTVGKLERESSPLAAVLALQRDLFALWWMQEKSGEFFESGFLNADQAQFVRQLFVSVCKACAPTRSALLMRGATATTCFTLL